MIGFLPRNPFPFKNQKKKVAKRSKNHKDSPYDIVMAFKLRAAKKAMNMLIQAAQLQYILFECSKCGVLVHSKCCGGSFPTLDLSH